ncbi:alpha/beta fold hydrolase [Rhodococcoides kyotonense]|uniref:Pimeloyl-ACP methyl ester carboxylesterase n=1 Tax=Rhodococcoides kyotonense TaxID=398843 RepID=A0A239F0I6_9NOCA|nr:alpha/beta hydrolase [Rhodococcus kyotonensis]SNS49604.1 Pimeloyl-ACP methyl ester carboxylesterase [Rhodococcus kyotonensis]
MDVSELGSSRTVPVDGGAVRVYERGSGKPIVFVHGLFTNAAVWRKVVPILAENYRCITADWPFGSHRIAMDQDADLTATGLAAIVAEVIDTLDLRDVTIVGNDGGGMLTQLVITRHPERIGRVVLTPCDAYENYPPRMFLYLCWLARVPATFEVLAVMMRVPFLRRLLGRSPIGYGWLTRLRLDDEVVDHYFTPVLDRSTRRDVVKFLKTVDKQDTLDAAQKFGNVTLPVLVAWASADKFFPVQHAERFVADFPDSRLEIIDDSRTLTGEDQPEQLASSILRFIGETTARSAENEVVHRK